MGRIRECGILGGDKTSASRACGCGSGVGLALTPFRVGVFRFKGASGECSQRGRPGPFAVSFSDANRSKVIYGGSSVRVSIRGNLIYTSVNNLILGSRGDVDNDDRGVAIIHRGGKVVGVCISGTLSYSNCSPTVGPRLSYRLSKDTTDFGIVRGTLPCSGLIRVRRLVGSEGEHGWPGRVRGVQV